MNSIERMHKRQAKIIGRTTRVSLPEFDVHGILAKVDTGAYTSALHCSQIKGFTKDGVAYVSFHMFDPAHHQYEKKERIHEISGETTVQNSFGNKEKRYKIKTVLRRGKKDFKIEFTLANRSTHRVPILLGRKFVKHNKFVVDVSLRASQPKEVTQ
jgi:hypothetical protein